MRRMRIRNIRRKRRRQTRIIIRTKRKHNIRKGHIIQTQEECEEQGKEEET